MTNDEIVFHAAIENGIYSEEEAVELYEEYGTLFLYTFSVWKKMGYTVKKGEHALICTRLWTPKKFDKSKATDEEDDGRKMYLKKSYLFSKDQVEKITEKKAAE